MELGPSEEHGVQCRHSEALTCRKFLLEMISKVHFVTLFFQIGNSCFKLVVEAARRHVRRCHSLTCETLSFFPNHFNSFVLRFPLGGALITMNI